ncbi:MAG TPA: hypothetical protein VLG16_02690 [Candidatus Saccharimonadales bacterium]|nr:hypothetical protein [Candidatus Saccharimonadales bacterium]
MERLLLQPEAITDGSLFLFEAYRTLGPTDEELQAQREAFTEAVENIMADHVTQSQRDAIYTAAGVFEWFHFSERAAELPVGLTNMLEEEQDTKRVMVDESVISETDLAIAWRAISNASAIPITGQIPQLETPQQIQPAIETYLRTTEAYKFVQTLITPEPQGRQTQPLSQHRRIERESEVTNAILALYRLKNTTEIQRRTGIDSELQHRLYRINDETMLAPQPQPSQTTDIQGTLRTFFEPHLLYELQQTLTLNSQKLTSVSYDPNSKQWSGLIGTDVTSASLEASHEYSTLITLGSSLYKLNEYSVTPLICAYLDTVCAAAYSQELQTPQDLERALSEAAAWITERFSTQPLDNSMTKAFTARAYLYDSRGPTYRDEDLVLEEKAPNRLSNNNSEFLALDQMYEAASHSAGFVVQPDYVAPPVHRLIQTTEQTETLPAYDSSQTLTILFEADLDYPEEVIGEGEQPSIPGYKTVSHDAVTDVWGLAYDPDTDPHVYANVPIPEEGILKLMQQYEDIGLDDLAGMLRDSADMVVGKLVEAIKAHTTYYIPENSSASHSIEHFTDFAVSNGKLYLQCTGSALFLAMSLNEAFGSICASTQSGLLLCPDDVVISQLGHAQVAFTDNGRMYILDATANSPLNIFDNNTSLPTDIRPRTTTAIRPTPSQRRLPAERPTASIDSAMLKQHATNTFKQYLMATYKVQSVEQLYDRVAAFRSDDPIRATLANLMTRATKEQLQRNRDFIYKVATTSEVDLAGANLEQYFGHDILRVTISALDTIIALSDD